MTAKIIAELCQNHNGNSDLLWKMLESAKQSGATHAKIQNLYSFELTQRAEFESDSPGRFAMFRPFETEFKRLQKLDLSADKESEFVSRCLQLDLVPMTTVFTFFGVQRAKEAGFRTIKIPSYGCTDIQLTLEAAKFADNIVMSTGATTMLELEYVMYQLRDIRPRTSLDLLHCRTEYPNQFFRIQMSRMIWLKEKFGDPVGYSDHTARVNENGDLLKTRLLPIKVALLLGAEVIEKHFTILNYDQSKDGRISADEHDLAEISRFSRLSLQDMHGELRESMDSVEEIIAPNANDFDPTVEEWFNRRYYRGRVKSS